MADRAPDIERSVQAALGAIDDPCMCLAGKGLSILDMGIVNSVAVDVNGCAEVSLTFTDPTCLFEFRITNAVHTALMAIPGVRAVDIRVECLPVWTNDRLSPKAQASFARDAAKVVALRDAPRAKRETEPDTGSSPDRSPLDG